MVASCKKANEDFIGPSTTNGKDLMKSNPVTRSLSGSIQYALTTTQNLPCACNTGFFSSGIYAGSGTLTHLGLSSSLINPCVTYTASGLYVGTECNTLIAANGDELHCLILPYNLYWGPGGNASGVSQVTITGGTGRFTGATGQLSGVVTIHTTTQTADFTSISGTVTY